MGQTARCTRQGDVTPLQHNSAYTIEFNAKVSIPEWNDKELRLMPEEQAMLTPTRIRYFNGRQKELLLMPQKG